MSMPSSENNKAIEPLDLFRIFEQHPVLETERLILRPITVADADEVFEYGSDPEVTKYMIFPTHTTLADSIMWLETVPDSFAKRERMTFAITLKADGKFIGSSGFHDISPKHHRLMMGYVLSRNYWGNGYMTEAVREMILFAFEDMGMHRVAATCDYDNIRSARVMDRCGMTLEGVLRDYEVRRGKFIATKSYAILKKDYEKRQVWH
jgi:[ribosomal protein S5]-alanine N-acetyltransferase